MNTSHKRIRELLQMSGLSQERLAERLGVSFVTLNAWANDRSVPRKGAQERINALWREFSGQEEVESSLLQEKKKEITRRTQRGKNVRILRQRVDLREELYLSLTYHSNRIEGSTLTQAETADVLFEGKTFSHRTLREQMEAKNHAAAVAHVLDSDVLQKTRIEEKDILFLHKTITNGILEDAGMYRRHSVRIIGSNIPTAHWVNVPEKMRRFIRDADAEKKDQISHIARSHAVFEQIHPFSDGNGRMWRMLVEIMALRFDLPPALFSSETKHRYYAGLRNAQLHEDTSLLEDVLCDAFLAGASLIEEKE